MLSEDCSQIVRRHKAVGDMACRAVVVRVDLLAAHAVCHRQGATGDEQAGKYPNQTLRIGEMRKPLRRCSDIPHARGNCGPQTVST